METTATAPAEPGPAPDPWPETAERYARMAADEAAELDDWYAGARARVRARPRRGRQPAAVPAPELLPGLPAPVPARIARLEPLAGEERQQRGRHARPRGERVTRDTPEPRDHASVWLSPQRPADSESMTRFLSAHDEEDATRVMDIPEEQR